MRTRRKTPNTLIKEEQQQGQEQQQNDTIIISEEKSPSTPSFSFKGVTYSTYEEMVHAKRAFNQQVLEKSGLLEASANIRHVKKADTSTSRLGQSLLGQKHQRGLRSARKRKTVESPSLRRKSSRIAGIESVGMFIEEERMGGKVVIGGLSTGEKGMDLKSQYIKHENVIVESFQEGKFYNNRVNDGSDLSIKDAVELTGSKWVRESSVTDTEAFVSKLSDIVSHHTEGQSMRNKRLLSSQLSVLNVDQHECVAKVVPDRIYSVAFHPCSQKLFAVTGDKTGYLGMWDVDTAISMNSDNTTNGVYLFKPHSGAINSLEWNKSGSTLLSQSYDGTIRLFDIRRQVFTEAFAAYDTSEEFRGKIGYGMDEGNKFYTQYACYDHRNEDCIFLSTSLGGVLHIDLRSKAKLTFMLHLSEKKINSLR
jgi:WD40 repeat protein